MADTGWQSPTKEDGLAFDFTNPSNAYSSDNTYATVDAANSWQTYGGFGFDIPTDATITKITVSLEHKQTEGGVFGSDSALCYPDSDYELSYPDSEPIAGSTESTDTIEFTSLGTLTLANVNSSDFYVLLRLIDNGNEGEVTYSLDHIQAKVYYTVASGTNMKINIGDTFKEVPAMKINIGDTWKDVTAVKQNIGDVWKTVF